MNLTPETIDLLTKSIIAIIAAIGSLVGVVIGAVNAVQNAKNRRDLHVAHDRIREIKGEPLQHRDDPDRLRGAQNIAYVRCHCQSPACPECRGTRP